MRILHIICFIAMLCTFINNPHNIRYHQLYFYFLTDSTFIIVPYMYPLTQYKSCVRYCWCRLGGSVRRHILFWIYFQENHVPSYRKSFSIIYYVGTNFSIPYVLYLHQRLWNFTYWQRQSEGLYLENLG